MPEEPPPPTPKADPPEPSAALVKAVEAALAKHADPNAALRAVIADLHAARDEVHTLKGRLPREGHVVLDPDGAASFEAYRALGSPADLTKAIEDGRAAAAKVAEHDRVKFHAEVAAAAGFRPTVLDRMAVQDGLTLVLKDGKDARTGKAVKVAHVKGEGDATTPLADYAAKHWADFLPALKDEAAKPAAFGSPPGDRGAPRPAIVPTEPVRRRNSL